MKMFKDGEWKETGWELTRRESANGPTRWANMLKANGIHPYPEKQQGGLSRAYHEPLITVHRVNDREPHGAQFYVQVGNEDVNLLECLVWDGVNLITLLTQWAPLAQAETLDQLAEEFVPHDDGPGPYGTYEKIAEQIMWVVARDGDTAMQLDRAASKRRRIAAEDSMTQPH